MPTGTHAPPENRLREFRVTRLLTQKQLAKKAKVDRTSVSHVERRLRKPSDLWAEKVARALGLPTDLVFPDLREKSATA